MSSGRSMMNRRYFLGAAASGAGALLLPSCARGSNSATATGGGTVTAAGWDDGFQDLVVGPIAEGFEAKSKIKFKPQAAVSGDDYSTRFRTLLAGGQPPDFMRLDDDFLPEISGKKLAKDIGPYIEESGLKVDDYYENVFNFSKLSSGQRAVQIAAQNRCIFYNKTMFEKEGVPLPPTTWTDEGWTWEDFLDAAKALTKAPDQWGAVIAKDGAYENMWAVNNGGPGTFSEDGHTFTLADEIGLEAMQWCCDLITKHKVCPSWGDLQPDQADQRLFTGGKLGMYQSGTSTIAYFGQNIKDFEWDVAPIPGRENQIQEASMVLFIIPEKAKNPDLAWDFLEYAMGPEGGKIIAESGIGIPTHREAAGALKAPGKYPANMDLLVEASDHLRSRNFTNATSAALNIYRPQMERAYAGEITVAEALNGVRDQVEAAIAV